MNTPNPYLEYVTPQQTNAPGNEPPAPLSTLFSPKHVFSFGPLTIDCDLDPSDGVMGVTCSLLGFTFMEQKFTAKDGSVSADCTRGPASVHVQLTPNFTNHSVAYQIKLCMLTACTNLAGTMGGFTAPQAQ